MFFGAVAFMRGETVAGKFLIELIHESVARDLGDDRGHRDAQGTTVARDDAGVRIRKIAQRQAVDQHARRDRRLKRRELLGRGKKIGLNFVFKRAGRINALQRAAHGNFSRTEDIELRDFGDVGRTEMRMDFSFGGESFEVDPE